MSQLVKNILFYVSLVLFIGISVFFTYKLIGNHNGHVEEPKQEVEIIKKTFKEVSSSSTINVLNQYPVNPINVDFSDKVTISGLLNKEVQNKINEKLSLLDTSFNSVGYNYCEVLFNVSNVLSVTCNRDVVSVNLINGEDIVLEDLFQKDTDFYQMIREYAYKIYCSMYSCSPTNSYSDTNRIEIAVTNFINDVINQNYYLELNNTYAVLSNNNVDDYIYMYIQYNQYLNDITLFDRFLTNDDLYENEVIEYCYPSSCYNNIYDYKNVEFLNNNIYLETELYMYDINDKGIDLDVEKFISKLKSILILNHNLNESINNYKNINIYVNLDIMDDNVSIVNYNIYIKENDKNNFDKDIMGEIGYDDNLKYNGHDLILNHNTLDISYMTDNPNDYFVEFKTTLYNYIESHLVHNGNGDGIYIYGSDEEIPLKINNFVDNAKYKIDFENNQLLASYYHIYSEYVADSVKIAIPLSEFTLKN